MKMFKCDPRLPNCFGPIQLLGVNVSEYLSGILDLFVLSSLVYLSKLESYE